MPIQLTTPFDPGDFNQGQTFTHVQPIPLSIDESAQRVSGYMVYGTYPGGVFTPAVDSEGRHIGRQVIAENVPGGDQDYDTYAAIVSNDAEKCESSALRAFCVYAVGAGEYAGTVV